MGDEHEFTYSWELRNFSSLTTRVQSEEFEVGSHAWRLLCDPKQVMEPWTHMSLFLDCVHAAHIPKGRGPTVSYTLTVLNHIDPERSVSYGCEQAFSTAWFGTGFITMLPLTEATVEAGFLRPDGTMAFTVEMSVSCKRRKTARSEDLLSLLGPAGSAFSDVTILVGDRSFPAHRAILAARCPYFATQFTSGVGDSAAKEVQLPEVDPDAFALLLRVMYGGALEDCPRRPLLYTAAELANYLQMTEAYKTLCDVLIMTCTRATVVEDLLWAAGRDNTAELRERLEAYLLKVVGSLDQEKVEQFMQRNTSLAAKVMLALAAKVKAS